MKIRPLATLLAAVLILVPSSAWCTVVQFNVLDMTGATNDVTIKIKPVNNPVIWNGGMYWQPANGTNVTTTNGFGQINLIPGNYTAFILGQAQSWQLNVTNSASALPSTALTRNLTFYSGVQSLIGSGVTQVSPGVYSITGGGGSATNVSVVITNGDGSVIIASNGPASYALSAGNLPAANLIGTIPLASEPTIWSAQSLSLSNQTATSPGFGANVSIVPTNGGFAFFCADLNLAHSSVIVIGTNGVTINGVLALTNIFLASGGGLTIVTNGPGSFTLTSTGTNGGGSYTTNFPGLLVTNNGTFGGAVSIAGPLSATNLVAASNGVFTVPGSLVMTGTLAAANLLLPSNNVYTVPGSLVMTGTLAAANLIVPSNSVYTLPGSLTATGLVSSAASVGTNTFAANVNVVHVLTALYGNIPNLAAGQISANSVNAGGSIQANEAFLNVGVGDDWMLYGGSNSDDSLYFDDYYGAGHTLQMSNNLVNITGVLKATSVTAAGSITAGSGLVLSYGSVFGQAGNPYIQQTNIAGDPRIYIGDVPQNGFYASDGNDLVIDYGSGWMATFSNGLTNNVLDDGSGNMKVKGSLNAGNYIGLGSGLTNGNGTLIVSLTNGLATTAYVQVGTNALTAFMLAIGLASTNYSGVISNAAFSFTLANGANETNFCRQGTNALAGTNLPNIWLSGPAFVNTLAVSNSLTASNAIINQLSQTNLNYVFTNAGGMLASNNVTVTVGSKFIGNAAGVSNALTAGFTNYASFTWVSGGSYTAPASGFVFLSINLTNGQPVAFSNATSGYSLPINTGAASNLGTNNGFPFGPIPVNSGDILWVTNTAAGSGANIATNRFWSPK